MALQCKISGCRTFRCMPVSIEVPES